MLHNSEARSEKTRQLLLCSLRMLTLGKAKCHVRNLTTSETTRQMPCVRSQVDSLTELLGNSQHQLQLGE